MLGKNSRAIFCVRVSIALAVGVIISSTTSHLFAGILAYDGFAAGSSNASGEYIANPGTDVSGRHKFIAGQDPVVSGFSGSWTGIGGAQFEMGAIPPSSLAYPGVTSTGNAAFRKFTSGASTRALDAGLGIGTNGTTTYFSFLMKLDDASALGRIEFQEGSSGGANGGGLRIRSDGTNFIASAGFMNNTIATADTDTHLFVFRVDFSASDSWSVWMDPTDLNIEANSATIASGTVAGPSSIDPTYLTFKRGTSGGTGGNGVMVDEIRIATDWGSDLFGAAVPEPSSLIYVVLGSLLLVSKRR